MYEIIYIIICRLLIFLYFLFQCTVKYNLFVSFVILIDECGFNCGIYNHSNLSDSDKKNKKK